MLPDLKMPSTRLPVEPLIQALPREVVMNIDPRSLQDWRERGVTFRDADKMAVRNGFHPVEIWGGLWNTSELHEDIVRAGHTVVEAIKRTGSIDMKELIKSIDVSTDYVRDIIKWVEELGCVRVETHGPQRKKVLYYEKDFDEY